MLKEFRYQGLQKTSGSIVRGTISAHSSSKAKDKIKRLSDQHNFEIKKIEKKKTFLYNALNKQGQKIKGEQEAYSKSELFEALNQLGYSNIKVQPKLLDFKFKPPFGDIVMFISLCADMLNENMKYDEILKILSNDVSHPTLKTAIKKISRDLRKGQDAEVVFKKYTDVFGKFTAYMLGLASKSGNMAEVYKSTATYLNRAAEFRKNLRQALVMPIVTLLAITGAVIYYVGKLFPDLTEMFIKFDIPLPPMTKATLDVSYFLQDNWLIILAAFVVPIASILYWWSTPKGALQRDKIVLSIPVVGQLIHKMSIEIFFRVFSIIYSGSGNNIEVLQISAEACGNKYMEKQIKDITIPLMLKEGAGLIDSINASGVFTETVISRLNAGAATGSVRTSAEQIATYYEKETGYKFKAIISSIDITTALVIMVVMTFLIIVSSESAFIRPPTPGVEM